MLNLRPNWLKLQPCWLKEKVFPEQLADVSTKLLQIPFSTDELLLVLDRTENLLGKVSQSPSSELQKILTSCQKSLVEQEILGHASDDVKVAAIACICEITRITAPKLPYDDDQMKEIFKLIVFSFGSLSNSFSRSYTKAINILNIVAESKLFVLMLDLECDKLIHSMFELFLTSITSWHHPSVFEDMKNIMSTLIEESDYLSLELIPPLLACMEENSREVSEIGRQLGKQVVENCSTILTPYFEEVKKRSEFKVDAPYKDNTCDKLVEHCGLTAKNSTKVLTTVTFNPEVSYSYALSIPKFIKTSQRWSIVSIQVSKHVMLRPMKHFKGTQFHLDDCSLNPLVTYRIESHVGIPRIIEGTCVGLYLVGNFIDILRAEEPPPTTLEFIDGSDKYDELDLNPIFQPQVNLCTGDATRISYLFSQVALQVDESRASIESKYSLASRDLIWKYLVYWKNHPYAYGIFLQYLVQCEGCPKSASQESKISKFLTRWKNRPKSFSESDLSRYLVCWKNRPKISVHSDSWRYLVQWTNHPKVLLHGGIWKYLLFWKGRPRTLFFLKLSGVEFSQWRRMMRIEKEVMLNYLEFNYV